MLAPISYGYYSIGIIAGATLTSADLLSDHSAKIAAFAHLNHT